jgi:hypothetical protein
MNRTPFVCAFLGGFTYENELVKEIEPPHLEERAIRVSRRSTQPSMPMTVSMPLRCGRKKNVACAVFAMISAGAATSADLRWQCAIRRAQENA